MNLMSRPTPDSQVRSVWKVNISLSYRKQLLQLNRDDTKHISVNISLDVTAKGNLEEQIVRGHGHTAGECLKLLPTETATCS